MAIVEEERSWSSFGEVPSSDPAWLEEPAQDYFQKQAENLGRKLKDDHEVATVINNRFISVLGEHKKGITEVTAAGLTVAGLLLAANRLRVRLKK